MIDLEVRVEEATEIFLAAFAEGFAEGLEELARAKGDDPFHEPPKEREGVLDFTVPRDTVAEGAAALYSSAAKDVGKRAALDGRREDKQGRLEFDRVHQWQAEKRLRWFVAY